MSSSSSNPLGSVWKRHYSIDEVNQNKWETRHYGTCAHKGKIGDLRTHLRCPQVSTGWGQTWGDWVDNSGGVLISALSGGGSNLLARVERERGGWESGKMRQIVQCWTIWKWLEWGEREKESGMFYVSVVSTVMESPVVFVVTPFPLQNHPAIGRHTLMLCSCTHNKHVKT